MVVNEATILPGDGCYLYQGQDVQEKQAPRILVLYTARGFHYRLIHGALLPGRKLMANRTLAGRKAKNTWLAGRSEDVTPRPHHERRQSDRRSVSQPNGPTVSFNDVRDASYTKFESFLYSEMVKLVRVPDADGKAETVNPN